MLKRLVVVMFMLTFLAVQGVQPHAQNNTLLIWADTNRIQVLEGLTEQFTAKFGVDVVLQEKDFGAIRDDMIVANPAGEGPDIAIGAHDWTGQLVANGVIEPLAFLQDDRSLYDPVALEAWSIGADIYALPYATEAIALIRNTDLIPDEPATFEDLLTVAKGLTDKDAGTFGILINAFAPDPFHSFPFISAFGGYIFGKNEDGSLNPCDIGLGSEGAVEGATFLRSLIDDGFVPAATGYGDMTGQFNAGKVGAIITGPWAVADVRNAGINFAVSKIPTIKGNTPGPFVGSQGFMINSFSNNKELAVTFLQEFIGITSTQVELFNVGDRAPALLSALAEVSDDPTLAAFAASAADGSPMPNIPEMSSVWGAWGDALSLVSSGESDPATAFTDAAARISETLGCN